MKKHQNKKIFTEKEVSILLREFRLEMNINMKKNKRSFIGHTETSDWINERIYKLEK